MTDTKDCAALQAREHARCAALMAGDAEALDPMLADDLVHIHLNGMADGKASYLAGVRDAYRFRGLSRGDLTIRSYGDFAVMTGPLSQQLEVLSTGQVMDVRAMTTQTWLRQSGEWVLNTCHSTPLQS
ncbi:nuclear transport factor 2 family protein [Tritonibacter horizontis]|uniref:DUF4440 domain-containing protein n=1 Tax=Tritonibacter horizontis TaxID=1768241 RepID=A0A132BQS8_9RHOB|nr:nuclear transport factor 2 family protein [Tritonibacter horizontis]KUP90755.1 hypothetical protein TRIHO_43000 [Tritonibacter horizontis]